VPGQAESAPHEFRIWRTVIRVTIVATVAFAIFLLNYHYGWVTPHSLDFSGRLDDASSQ
jgi:predicted secreted protein